MNVINSDNYKNGVGNLNLNIDFLKQINLHKIELMSTFEDNWNGNGGLAFSKSAIQTFKTVIKNLHRQPEIAPTGRNTLLMQYELPNQSRLAFEVSESNVESVFVPYKDFRNAETNTFTENFSDNINRYAKRFY